jgi:hypothetical protein
MQPKPARRPFSSNHPNHKARAAGTNDPNPPARLDQFAVGNHIQTPVAKASLAARAEWLVKIEELN